MPLLSSPVSRMRRNPVKGRQPRVVAGLASFSAVLAFTIDARPTGSTPIDVALVAAASAAVTWAAATGTWWLLAGVALLAAGTAASVPLALVGLVAVVIASLVGAGRHNLPWARSLVALLCIQVLARCEVGLFFGWSAVFTCTSLAMLFVWGAMRRPSSVRRRVWQVVGVVGAAAAVAIIGFTIAALNARGPLQEGNRQARVGLAALNRGDTAAAQAAFADSAKSFRQADDALSAPWAQAARLVPVAAQHRASVSQLAAGGASGTTVAASALTQIDPETVRIIDGRIDIAAVRALEAPLVQLAETITQLQQVVKRAQSPWLVGPLQRRLTSLDDELVNNHIRADNAVLAVQVAPQMLGESGVRRYFVAFTTPAEARGLGGFMGNWAEITITDGRIQMTEFGRPGDLARRMGDQQPTLTGLDEFIGHWGRFGFADEPDGAADDTVWSIVTMAPDFPTVAQVIGQLYPQSGGQPIDGVFMLDSQAIATLLNFTGPIDIDAVEQPLTADNAAQFINKDQYLLPDSAQRADLLEQIARTAVIQLLSTALPPPAELANEFAPLAAAGRLMFWSSNPDEQELLERVNMDGTFPALAGAEGIAVTVDNASGNKIDAYLEMTVQYEVVESGPDGVRTSTATITLTNAAPAAGLPPYVIGNLVDLPEGTNRTWLSVYTALPMVAVEVDGKPDGMQTSQVFDWHVATRFVDIPPGGTVTITLRLQGSLPGADALPFVQRVQALVISPEYRFESHLPALRRLAPNDGGGSPAARVWPP